MDLLTSTNSELQFGSVGCQYVDKGSVCGEKDSLAIIVEMQKMYEEKMSILDREGGGDYEALQAKNRLQEMWIKDLIQQSKMLISAIQELEREATERVRLLEQRIKKNSHTGTEVMTKYRDLDIKYNISETYQSVVYLQSDVLNLVKLIKQFQNDGVWSPEGFHFYLVNTDDLKFDTQRNVTSNRGKSTEPKVENYTKQLEDLKKGIQEKDMKIKKLETVIKDLRTKTGSKNANGVEEIKRAMEDMRSALTTEVAEKHEIILSLRRDIHQLEEQCKQADKQMIFKDDIIKEMRKDIKHLKSEYKPSEAAERKRLEEDISRYQGQKHNLNTMIETLTKENGDCQGQRNTEDIKDLEQYRKTYTTVLEEIVKRKRDDSDVFLKISEAKSGLLVGQEGAVDIESLCHEIKYLRTEKDEILKNFDTLKHSYIELNTSYQKLKDHEDVITKGEYEKMKKEFIEQTKKDYEEELKQLKNENMTIKEKYEAGLIELEKAIKEKEMREEKMRELGCAIQQCEEYQKKYEKGMAEIERINKEKEEHEKKINELEQSLRGFEECKTKYAESVKEIDNLRAKATQATFEFQEELKLAGRKGQPNEEKEKENLRRKAMVALDANNNLQVQCLKKLEEKMKEIYIFKRQIETLEGKAQVVRESNSGEERDLKEKEISNLKDCIKQLEGGQACTKLAAESLQTMVNKYRKTVAELEETEKRLRTEISQQNTTIFNLQEALLASKQELEEIRQKAVKEICKRVEIMNSLYRDLIKTEEDYSSSSKKCEKLAELLNNLRDDYLDLEVENFNHLQDIEMLDSLVLKYQQINKLNEQSMRAAVKKMKIEKQEYENVISYLKTEMAILSDQLQKLQHLLKIANTSNLDMENKTLAGNLIDAQAVNNVLQEQLKVAETQLTYEMKMNKHYITLTEELQDKLSSETVRNHRIQQKAKEIQFQLEKSNSFVRSLENTVKDLENTIILYERDLELGRKREKQQDNEIEIYRTQLRDVTEKFMDLEERYKELEIELEVKTQSMLEKENKIKQDYEERERVRADLGQQLTYAKEELGGLRIEMNKTITTQNALRVENEKLKTQLNTLHVDRNALEQQVIERTQEVEQYLLEIQSLQADKETTEQKYMKLKAELQGLQSAFDNLSKQYMNKAESLISLEMELVDTKSSHTQLCNESKKVVDNVRCWLEEQKEINLKLERNIKEKEDTINKLRGEIRNLKCNLTLPNKLPTTYERRPTHPLLRTSLMQALSPTHPWSLGSQESESSYSTNPAEGDEETATSDVDTTESWLYRVESMTEQLQRSNNYWKTRIHDNEYMVTRDQ